MHNLSFLGAQSSTVQRELEVDEPFYFLMGLTLMPMPCLDKATVYVGTHVKSFSWPCEMFPDNSHCPDYIVANFHYMNPQVEIISGVRAQGIMGENFPMKRILLLMLKVSVYLFGITHHSIRVAFENVILIFSYIVLGPDHCRATIFFMFSYYFLWTRFVPNNSLHTP